MKNEDKKGLKDKDEALYCLVTHEAFNMSYFASNLFDGKKSSDNVKFYNKLKGEKQHFNSCEIDKLRDIFVELQNHMEIQIEKSNVVVNFQNKLNKAFSDGELTVEDIKKLSKQLNF